MAKKTKQPQQQSSDGQKKPRQVMSYTPHQINELKKCSEDIFHFIENYVRIVDPVKGNVPFVLYDYQREIIKGFLENRNVVALASRQLGKCLQSDVKITIRNKKTNKIYSIPIGCYYEYELARRTNQKLPDISEYENK